MISRLRTAVSERLCRILGTLFISICLLGFSLYLLESNLKANWYIIDDHEVMHFLGSDRAISFSEITSTLLNKTEVGTPGETSRYRPSYYVLRLLESWIWGDAVKVWYGFRVFVHFLFLLTAFSLLRNIVPALFAALFAMYLGSMAFFGDVFARLGPAEFYAVIGVCMMSLAFKKLYRTKLLESNEPQQAGAIQWSLLSLGAIISLGAKENLVVVLAPIFLLLWIDRKKPGIWKYLSSGLVCTLVLLVAASVGLALAKVGTDIYGNSTNLSSRFLLVGKGIGMNLVGFLFWFSSFALLLLWFCRNSLESDKRRPLWCAARNNFLCQFCLISLYLSQFLFYNGHWPTGIRYDFPGLLTKPISLLILAHFVIDGLRAYATAQRFLRWSLLLAGVISVLIFLPEQASTIRLKATENSKKSQEFFVKMTHVVEQIKANPGLPVIISSHNIYDYEPIFSLVRYLDFFDTKNRRILNISSYSAATASGIEKTLATTLEGVAHNGGMGFSKSTESDSTQACFGISLSGEAPSRCSNYLGKLW